MHATAKDAVERPVASHVDLVGVDEHGGVLQSRVRSKATNQAKIRTLPADQVEAKIMSPFLNATSLSPSGNEPSTFAMRGIPGA